MVLVAAVLGEAAAAVECESLCSHFPSLPMIWVALASVLHPRAKVSTPHLQRVMIMSGMSLGFMTLLALVTLFARRLIPHWIPLLIIPLTLLSTLRHPSYLHFSLP